jgi:hypothetical protein
MNNIDYAKKWDSWKKNNTYFYENGIAFIKHELDIIYNLCKPTKLNCSTVYAYQNGEVVYKGSYDEWIKKDKKLYFKNLDKNKTPVIEYSLNEKLYEKEMKDYKSEYDRIVNIVIDVLFKLFDFEYAPIEIKNLCWLMIEDRHDFSCEHFDHITFEELGRYIFITKNIYQLSLKGVE